jgi:hypothetical protein
MRVRIAITLISALFLSAIAPADQDEALHTLERLLELNAAGQLQTPEARSLLTGEALTHWSTDTIGPISGSPNSIVATDGGGLAARVSATAPNGETKDFYFYLRKTSQWQVSAMRTLSAVGPLYMVRDMEPGKLAAIPGGTYTAENARLTLFSDRELRSWFQSHAEELRQLAALLAQSSTERYRVDPAEPDNAPITQKLRELALSSARRLSNGSEIVVGGIIDNSVGFFHLRSGEPPPISPEEYIWVESLGGGWYLFRTT